MVSDDQGVVSELTNGADHRSRALVPAIHMRLNLQFVVRQVSHIIIMDFILDFIVEKIYTHIKEVRRQMFFSTKLLDPSFIDRYKSSVLLQ